MSEMSIHIRPGESVAVDAFEDLTGQTADSIEPAAGGGFTITFGDPLTPAQEVAVRLRCLAVNEVEETLLTRARNALAGNAADIEANNAWLAANPTASPVLRELARQSTAQARQLSALIRIAARALDTAD